MVAVADTAVIPPAATTGSRGGGLFLGLLGLLTGAKASAADHPSSDGNDSIRCQGKHAFKRENTG